MHLALLFLPAEIADLGFIFVFMHLADVLSKAVYTAVELHVLLTHAWPESQTHDCV